MAGMAAAAARVRLSRAYLDEWDAEVCALANHFVLEGGGQREVVLFSMLPTGEWDDLGRRARSTRQGWLGGVGAAAQALHVALWACSFGQPPRGGCSQPLPAAAKCGPSNWSLYLTEKCDFDGGFLSNLSNNWQKRECQIGASILTAKCLF